MNNMVRINIAVKILDEGLDTFNLYCLLNRGKQENRSLVRPSG